MIETYHLNHTPRQYQWDNFYGTGHMRSFYRLGHDGTVRLARAVGAKGTVYVPIPSQGEGTGKVQLQLQGRIVECQATTTASERLSTGTKVQVVNIVGPSTVCVEQTAGTTPAD